MDDGRMRSWLSPLDRESHTRLRLCGSSPTVRLESGLVFRSGEPGESALSADAAAANWCEWWTDLLAGMSVRRLLVRYRRARRDDDC